MYYLVKIWIIFFYGDFICIITCWYKRFSHHLSIGYLIVAVRKEDLFPRFEYVYILRGQKSHKVVLWKILEHELLHFLLNVKDLCMNKCFNYFFTCRRDRCYQGFWACYVKTMHLIIIAKYFDVIIMVTIFVFSDIWNICVQISLPIPCNFFKTM